MSDQKLISPLLDGFVMGEPMSSHDGVRCCPAMRENSDEKYIVKIIRVPASQKQLDALLLTGAYPDAAAATEYFKEQADDIVREAELLKQLSRLEGFLSYDNWQIVPMEGSDLGYEVYLVGSYRRTLEKHMTRTTMTHLGAVNLGLDLCAALSICRRAGFIHVDLKPSNVFLTGQREYRIGDLGFAKLSALKYTSLPSKYCSSYTPPELHDPLCTLNPTADIYAVGMILYRIYNNGVLPFEGKAPATALPAPMNADYEMAEIILKACDPNPRKRWQTPIEMGQALVSYMQRNTINDVPIVPPAADPAPEAAGEAPAAQQAEVETAVQPQELRFMEELVSDETAPDADTGEELAETQLTDEVNSMLSQADELLDLELPDLVVVPDAQLPEVSFSLPEESVPEAVALPEEAELPADSELPRDPVLPEKAAPADSDDLDFSILMTQPSVEQESPALTDVEDDADIFDDPFFSERPKKKKRRWLTAMLWILVLALLGGGGYYFYRNYYLLPIDYLELSPFENTLTVSITTDADESLLTVVCTDTYGNTFSRAVVDGQATFTDLNSATTYRVEVAAEGFHALSGSYTGTFTTAEKTQILDFTAKTGTEDGSVILSFAVEGPEQDWIVEYSAEGEEAKSVSFTGHMVTIDNLTVDKEYTFSLVTAPEAELYIVGNDTLTFTASRIIIAENVNVISCVDGVLTAQWSAPADAAVESWTVRCYAENGYDETVTVTEMTASFSGIAPENAYTVEVTASGMTQSARGYVTANPTTITGVTVDDSSLSQLSISWNSSTTPKEGWLVMYSIDGSDAQEVVKTSGTTAVITPRIPGTVYSFSIQSADGVTVFGGTSTYETPEARQFSGNNVNASDVSASLLPTPGKSGWTYKDVADDDYTATHAPGADVSMVLYSGSTNKPSASKDEIEVMFVIRDSQGNVVPKCTAVETHTWNTLWKNRIRYCSLDIPQTPVVPGSYTVEIYFNHALVVSKTLTITE